MWRSGLIGALLAAGCALDVTPDVANESTRAMPGRAAWQPDTLERAGASMMTQTESAGGGADDARDRADGVQSADAVESMADLGLLAASAGAAASAGGSGAAADVQPVLPPSAADAPAAGASGAAADAQPVLPPSAAGAPAAGSGGMRGTAGNPSPASSLVELTLGILSRAADASAQTAGRVLQGAATAGGLTAALVSSVLESLTGASVCTVEPGQCEQVCGVIRRDCSACAADETCHEEARAMCGRETADCVEHRKR